MKREAIDGGFAIFCLTVGSLIGALTTLVVFFVALKVF